MCHQHHRKKTRSSRAGICCPAYPTSDLILCLPQTLPFISLSLQPVGAIICPWGIRNNWIPSKVLPRGFMAASLHHSTALPSLTLAMLIVCFPASSCNEGKAPCIEGPHLALIKQWIIIRTHHPPQERSCFQMKFIILSECEQTHLRGELLKSQFLVMLNALFLPFWLAFQPNSFCTFFPMKKLRRGGGHVCFSKPGLHWKPLASSECCFAQFLVCKHAVKQLMSVKPLWASAPRGDEWGRSGISTAVSCSSSAALGSPFSGGSPINHQSWRRDFFLSHISAALERRKAPMKKALFSGVLGMD